jgi:hypothetical protein
LINKQIDNEKTEGQHPTAVLQKWRFSPSYDSEVVNQSLVLRLKFGAENRHLRKAAKRTMQAVTFPVRQHQDCICFLANAQ